MIKGLSEFDKYKVVRPIIGDCEYDSFHMPIIKAADTNTINWNNIVIQGAQNLTKKRDNSNSLIHMFLNDKKLLYYWNNPLKRIALFQSCAAVATPDFSIYSTMNYNEIQHNIYMNHWLGRTWQNYGVTVLPTIGWAGVETFDMCFSAIEIGCPVIISTLGCQSHIDEFLLGFYEMKRRIRPTIIIVFGDMIKGMTGKFINFRYSDSFNSKYIQMKFEGISAVFEIKEVV